MIDEKDKKRVLRWARRIAYQEVCDFQKSSLTNASPLYGKFRDYSKKVGQELHMEMKAFKGQALHAGLLGFIHPVTKEEMEFQVDLPSEMTELILKLNAIE